MPYTFCPRCGAKVEWGSSCSQCGSTIPLWDKSPGEKKTVESSEYPPPSREGQGIWRRRLGVILVALALVTVGALWVRSYSQNSTSPNQKPEPIPFSASSLLAWAPSPSYAPSLLDQEFLQRYGHPYYNSTQQEQTKIEVGKLEDLLGNIKKQVQFKEKYEEDYFDCSEMSAYMEYYLERNGYQASIFVGPDHAWVMVFSTEGWIPIETTNLFIPTPTNCDDYSMYSEPEERYDSIGAYWDSFHVMSELDWWETKYTDTLEKLA